MSWLFHPAYKRLLNEVSSLLAKGYREFHYLKPVVFLCGKFKSRRRISVSQRLRRRVPGVHVFFAEDVWDRVAEDVSNALDMENQLAGLSDCIVIIVESPGTFAELGAFANDIYLREKLFPILDEAYQDDNSFINTGPVKWVNATQGEGACLFTPFEPDFEATDEIEERIRRIPSRGRPTKEILRKGLADRPKDLLFMLCDLVSIIGPAPIEHIETVVSDVLGKKPTLPLETLLGLCIALDLVNRFEALDGVEYFYRPLQNGRLEVYQNQSLAKVVNLRARILNLLTGIPKAQKALDAMAGESYVA